jgi:outer membrane biosynthesis protein TonB
MKKKLNIDSITNELEGASLFFAKSAPSPDKPIIEKVVEPKPDSPITAEPPVEKQKPPKTKETKSERPNNSDTMTPRHHDTTVSRYHDTTTPHIHGVAIELVRKAVKEFGKEAATHRFTEAEKKEIASLIYTYKNRGIRTSENEITRIAVNFVLEDFRENGEESVLHKILDALNG